MIEIVLENGGIMTAELYPEVAPITVANFLKLADEKFFDGLIFHRVIPGFMIQGGGFAPNGKHKDAKSIKGEFQSNGVKNTLKHARGALSMARAQSMDSASSQFFVMVAPVPHLDGQYAAFGMVTEGMEWADDIVSQRRDSNDKPIVDQVIKTIRRKQPATA
jgi:peptidyl-prolyl cis-trans isomerase B (cyclophilin B)